MRKISIFFMWMFMLAGILIVPVYASEEEYQIIIEDDAQLLSESEEQALRAVMEEVAAYGNVAFKSINMNAASASNYISRYYEGKFGTSSGTVFLIDMDNREIWIYSDGTIHRTITDSYAEIITDNVYQYATNGDYFTCSYKAFEQMATLLNGGRIAQPMKYINNMLIALVIALLINYIIVQTTSSAKEVSGAKLLEGVSLWQRFDNASVRLDRISKKYDPESGSSSGSSGSGSSGGSGGGGGHKF